jgi:eukaryotic-like serine/threonine-protein kinase
MSVFDPEQWQRIQPILDEALSLPPDQRERRLRHACGGDAELRAAVDRVLRADDQQGGLLDGLPGPIFEEMIRDLEGDAVATGSSATPLPTGEYPFGDLHGALDGWPRGERSAPEPSPSFPGTPRFTCRRVLGSGGFGVVYEAFDHDQNAVVALKALRRSGASDVSHLKREFRSLTDTVHPNLVELYELLSDGAQWFFTMALIEGTTFDQYVRHHPHHVRDTLSQLVDGVNALHRAGKLHQDLKPSNVLVTPDGRVVILDFGLVADISLGSRATAVAGTLPYIAPERFLSPVPSTASDWYSVGVMLFQALTGRLPGLNETPPELDAVPPDLARLCRELLNVDPAARPSASEIVHRLRMQSSLPLAPPAIPFVGRTAEMDVLKNAFATVAGRGCAVVFVEGASGQGKTALINRFLAEMRRGHDLWILSGRCHPQESVPYNALDEIVEQMAEILPQARDDDTALAAQLFPVLDPDADRRAVSSAELRHAAAAALRTLVGRLAARQPLVVHVDDVHWASGDSRWLLSELLQAPGIAGTMWIVASRQAVDLPDIASPALRLQLGALASEDAIALAEHLLPRDVPDRDARAALVAREASGNPFLISEFALNTDRDVTGSLEAILHGRVARLNDEARCLLEIVAIAGDPIDSAVAWRAVGRGGVRQAAILALRANRLVQISFRGELEPYHDRMRQAVRAQMSPARIAERHLHLAVELDASGRGSAEALTVHYLEGGDHEKAFHHSMAAAAQATQSLAFESAVGFYRIASRLRPDSDDVRVSLADALSNAGRGGEAAELYLECLPRASAAKQSQLRRRAASEFLVSGHMQRGIETLQDVLGAIGIALPRSAVRALPSLLLLRARVRVRGLEPSSGIATRDTTEYMDALWAAAQGLAMVDSLRAAAFHARHLLLALDSDDRPRAAKALAIEAGYHAMFGARGRFACGRALELATQLADRSGDLHAVGLTRLAAGMAAFLEGRWAVACETLDAAEALLRERCTGVAWELGTARLVGCVSMFFLGEIKALSARLPMLLDSARSRGNVYESTYFQIRVAHAIHLARHAPAIAEEQVREAISRWPSDSFYLQHWWAFIVSIEIALYQGDAARAWEVVTANWNALRRSLLLNVQYIRVESRYHQALAALALASQDARRRPSLQRIALRSAQRIEQEQLHWGAPLARLIRAAVEPRAAVSHLRLAEASFHNADMKLFAAAARRRRGQLIGGSDGRALIADADAVMRAQAILCPDRMTAILSP